MDWKDNFPKDNIYYQTKNGILYKGNCLEIMKEFPKNSIDLVLTDPPYLLDNHGGKKANSDFGKRKLIKDKHLNFMSNGFDFDSLFNLFINISIIENFLIFCSNKQISYIMSYFENKNLTPTLLIWHKPNAIPLSYSKYTSDAEFIIYSRGKYASFNNDINNKYKRKVISINTLINNRKHPAEKPKELLKRLIRVHSKENQLVLDCFVGSGTTLVACEELNRRWIGIEIEEKYCEIAKKRLKKIRSRLI